MREMNIGLKHTIVLPSVSSENRNFLPVGLLDNRSTITNLAFALYDAPIWNMALIASRLHLVWISTVCGKMKTDFRYSNTLGWNTFPLPTLTEKHKEDLSRCAENILWREKFIFLLPLPTFMIPKPCRKICARRTTPMTKFWNAFILVADLKMIPNGSKSCLIFIQKWLPKKKPKNQSESQNKRHPDHDSPQIRSIGFGEI